MSRLSDSDRRKLLEVFGDALPDITTDERDDATSTAYDANEAWLKAQVPPHHGKV